MSLSNLTPSAPPPSNLVAAVVARAPTVYTDPLSVIVPSFDPDRLFEIDVWQPRGQALPLLGDVALVGFDEQGTPWLVGWDGLFTAAGGTVGPAGPAGATGTAGSPGTAGADGKTVRNGSGAPSNALGVDGDFYINTAANTIYGPKTAGAWGSATSLVGPTGPAGATTETVRSTVEDLKVIRGTVNTAGAGSIVVGSGFTITRTGTGDVTVNFSSAFSAAPSVVVTSNDALITRANTATTGSSRIQLYTAAGSLSDGIYHFIAIGPR